MEGVSVWNGVRGFETHVEFAGGLIRIVMLEVAGSATILRIRGDEAIVAEAALAMRITDEQGGLYCWLQAQGGAGMFHGVRDVVFAGSPPYGAEKLFVSFGAARVIVPL
ncbi:MAG: hypothetical protein Q7T71_07830 [Herbiconiux sp.]|nr:hypothetical protein [Herbiconiux sp.]